MENTATNLLDTNEKRNNFKRTNESPIISNSNSKISNFNVRSRTPSSDEATHKVMCPKPNQVSNVVLYGIPIVSLFIENQERLCLAQISNTLLKQFSYNEIHNRRVALGITCVQCTPVQLEILRRAGAMPVSSRRCGMITRREAERLCKSFLGDNSPPRLPDDFSFLVYHECAFGCRGAFLPSRYNSSRAKCIKCTYCGLFFSPNKFIFHSHRISQNDKYVQPDAANFNSWRRHLKLSGSPTENIAFAWEDVKAMFNGGTRKRLISPSSSSHGQHSAKVDISRKSKEMQNYSPPFPARSSAQPIQQIVSQTTPNDPPVNNQPLNEAVTPMKSAASSPPGFHQDLPFSLSHYVWHYQQQTQSISLNNPTNPSKGNNFQFPTLNWIKQQPTTLPPSFLFKPNGTSIAPINALSKDEKPPSTFNHFHSAAFKPVINMRLSNDESNVSVPILNHNSSPTSSTTNQSDDERLTPAKKFLNHIKYGKEKESDINTNENIMHEDVKQYDQSVEYDSKNDSQTDDENEMVDIESTEDDVNILNLQSFHSNKSEKDDDDDDDDDEEEIEVDEKVEKIDNNNTTPYKIKSSINSLTDITSNIEMQENYFIKKHYVNFSNMNEKEWQLKKESNKHNSPSNHVQKAYTTPAKTDGCKLWSVAKLSLECGNNICDDTLRSSLYKRLKTFQQVDTANGSSSYN